MIHLEIRTKQDLSYLSICSLSILYNSKFILMAMSLGTNPVVVTRIHCILNPLNHHLLNKKKSLFQAYRKHKYNPKLYVPSLDSNPEIIYFTQKYKHDV